MVKAGLAPSRRRAAELIAARAVQVNGLPAAKPARLVGVDDRISVHQPDFAYVGRGALKLEAAIQALELDVRGMICMDVGASTGGFTDCLLQHGAARVYAVDVGYGQIAWKLRQDARVIVMERTNIRHLPVEAISDPIDLITIDVSFISLKIVVPAVLKFRRPGGKILALIKPQFEVGKNRVGKGGVVRDSVLIADVIDRLTAFFSDLGLCRQKLVPSPITGAKGNRESVICLADSLLNSMNNT